MNKIVNNLKKCKRGRNNSNSRTTVCKTIFPAYDTVLKYDIVK